MDGTSGTSITPAATPPATDPRPGPVRRSRTGAPTGYTFGDGDVASTRLAMVAALFDPPTAGFLDRVLPARAATVVDLGCGPGHTTALLAARVATDRLVAVDASADFLTRAAARVPGIETACRDVTALPLPGAPADVVFARLLLAHLPDADATARAWASQLAPGGLLVLDEIDAIVSDVDVLATYERVVTELVASRGARMAAGPELDAFAADAAADGRLVADDRYPFPVDVAAVARMFALNLTVWGTEPAVAHHRRSGLLDEIAAGLDELARRPTGAITWHLRQLAVRATPA